MMMIWKQLTETPRHIVTNMVLDLDRLQSLLIERGHPAVCVRDRVRMLDDSQTKDFWLYRAFGVVLRTPSDYREKQGSDVDYTMLFEDPRFFTERKGEDGETVRETTGTCYVIDEVHTHWPARGAWGTPRHVTFYNSQHGKLGDICFFITQNTKLLDPNFIRLAQDFTYCRNHRLEKHGRFRGDDKFTAHTYPHPVESPREVTLNVETFHLDLPLAKCYDTSAGVGMPGGGTADGGERARGIPLWLIWVGVAVLAVGFWLAFKYGFPMLGGFIWGKSAKTADTCAASSLSSPATPGAPVRPAGTASPPPPGLVPGEGVLSDAAPPVAQAVRWVRLVRTGDRIHVHLTDGRIITAPSLVAYDAGGVVDFVDLEGHGWRLSRAMEWTDRADRADREQRKEQR
jgi:hypothetical protein